MRTIRNISNNSIISTESFNYDAAGNVTSAPSSSFQYDTNNRLISFNGNAVSYDLDGNMVSNGSLDCTYDSANRLVSAGGHTYTYNAENVRIRNLCADEDTTYTYNTNAKLSMLLMKTTGGVITKYVYGRGLIGEEVGSVFKTYHFDCRGSTIAITDASGTITDTFAYDTYGKLLTRTGTNKVIFGYNGRDGVVTDDNGLIYMRARYYSPEMRRFVNADIISGSIADSTSLNRYSYVNGNPVSYVDPFGLSAERSGDTLINYNKAIYVSDRRKSSGLRVVGHTRLYFLGDNGVWYRTEFAGDFPDKSSAEVVWTKDDDAEINDMVNGVEIDGVSYVVLEGNFNESAALAEHFDSNQDFGDYNLIIRNCSDYTDAILDVAEVEGVWTQRWVDGDALISIPVLREFEASVAQEMNVIVPKVEEKIETVGDTIKDGFNTVIEHIEDSAKKAWDWITFWD